MQQARTQNTRHEVLQAATNLLIEEGAHGFSVRKVAQGARISLGNLQYHFPTRHDLIHGLFHEIAARVLEAAGTHETEERQIFAFVDAIFDELDTPEGSIPVWELFAMAAHDDDLAEMLHQLFLPLRERISDFIKSVHPKRSSRICNNQATSIVALIEGSGLFLAYGRRHSDEFRGLRKQIKDTIKLIIFSTESPS